jgi:hypothetical protein
MRKVTMTGCVSLSRTPASANGAQPRADLPYIAAREGRMQSDETGVTIEGLNLTPSVRRLTTGLDVVLILGALAVMAGWFAGRPILYSSTTPVMSGFTAFSLLIMVLVRLARTHLATWPMALSLAMTGLVLGGNLSSILMLATMPPGLLDSFGDIVVTSIITSIGLMLFCLYDLVIVLRATPQSAFIFDDLLIHLALVPGGLSLLGYLLDNPGYLSIQEDPRIGISPLEMGFMGAYALSAVLSNPRLFLWQFLAAGWANRLVFGGLFINQFVAPLVVAVIFTPPGSVGPGVELYVLLAGVVATVSFLLLQAQLNRRPVAD